MFKSKSSKNNDLSSSGSQGPTEKVAAPASRTTAKDDEETDGPAKEGFFGRMKRKTVNAGHATKLQAYKTKKQTQNQILKKQLAERKRQFGEHYIDLCLAKSSAQRKDQCLDEALQEIREIQAQIDQNLEKMESKEEVYKNERIVPAPPQSTEAPEQATSGSHDNDSSNNKQNNNKGNNNNNKPKLWQPRKKQYNPNQDYYPDPLKEDPDVHRQSPPHRRPAPGRGGSPPGRGGGGRGRGAGGPPVAPGSPRSAGRGAPPPSSPVGKAKGTTTAAAAPSPAKAEKATKKSSHKNKMGLQECHAPPEFKKVDDSQWTLAEVNFDGATRCTTVGVQEKVQGKSIPEGIAYFKANPHKYSALFYQSSMVDWPVEQHQYTLVHRQGTQGFQAKDPKPQGWMTMLTYDYHRLPPFKDNVLPKSQRDKHTDKMTYGGKVLHSKKNPPILPGRGMGVGDTPLLKVIGDIDPSDIHQGQVGDCWLLSAISAVAEFDGAIKRLYRKTRKLHKMPFSDKANKYTVTLWDLTTWQEVDIEIDERLCAAPDGQLLASKPSEDGELWVCYLEKAIAIHAGGWDKLVGGQCTHAWALMTGCKEQYTIMKNQTTGKFRCYGRFNSNEGRWAQHGNSPHDGELGMWPMPWPEVGGGGDATLELSEDELFLRLVAWDQVNYIVGAGTGGESDKNSTGGLVDNHAYSVIESRDNVCGTGIGLLKVRNPWGNGEIEDGEFDDDGPGWDKYPEIKKELNPVVADDGIFWVTKEEFFQMYTSIYLSASNMTEFLED